MVRTIGALPNLRKFDYGLCECQPQLLQRSASHLRSLTVRACKSDRAGAVRRGLACLPHLQ